MVTNSQGAGPKSRNKIGILARSANANLQRAWRNPFEARSAQPLITHWSHHKAGTVWFIKVLGGVSDHFSMRIALFDKEEDRWERLRDLDVVVFLQTRRNDPKAIGHLAFRGTHIVRDPRDMLVSAYFYHLRTDEAWVHKPREKWKGQSYQGLLKSLSRTDGLFTELERMNRLTFKDMRTWDYTISEILELRYEDVLADEHRMMERIFRHYGFSDSAVDYAVDTALRFSLNSRDTKRDPHVRSGRPGQWKDVLEAEHILRFKELTGDLLVRLGYEHSSDW